MRTMVSTMAAAALGTLAVGCAAADPPPAPTPAPAPTAAPAPVEVPADVAAMLKAHRGRWRTEGEIVYLGEAKPATAAWECRAAVGGLGNVCTWTHYWPDGTTDAALEIMGYDPALGTMSITRVGDNGLIGTVNVTVRGNTMTVRRESVADGKTTVTLNEVTVEAPGVWVQHATTDVDGQRVGEMHNRHRRVE